MPKAVVLDPLFTEELLVRRRKLGLDRWDEYWDGVWHMPPAPSIEHQQIEGELFIVLKDVVERAGLGRVFHEVNVADPEKGLQDFRIPDISVVLVDGHAQIKEAFIAGGPDFVVEIHSPGDETYEKISWYSAQGVREVLVIDRDTKAVALYHAQGGQLVEAAASPTPVQSQLVPLRFELVEGSDGSRLSISHREEPTRIWVI